jgi:hypothetical protein
MLRLINHHHPETTQLCPSGTSPNLGSTPRRCLSIAPFPASRRVKGRTGDGTEPSSVTFETAVAVTGNNSGPENARPCW